MVFLKLKTLLQSNTLGAMMGHVALAATILLLAAVTYFYIFLPSSTNHGQEVMVPDLRGKDIYQIDQILRPLQLRYEVGDSAFSTDYPPLTVLQQFPKPGHQVKENRKVYVSVNRKSPPTLPLPNLFGEGGAGSLENAEAVLKSSELAIGRILYQRSPNYHLLIEIRMNGKVIKPGTRVPKGSVIDLVIGDGAGPRDFVISNFVGLPYQNVLLRMGNLSLHLGSVQIPEDVDTTGIVSYVIKQFPAAGDSVSIGDPINLWIGPKGYQLKDGENNE